MDDQTVRNLEFAAAAVGVGVAVYLFYNRRQNSETELYKVDYRVGSSLSVRGYCERRGIKVHPQQPGKSHMVVDANKRQAKKLRSLDGVVKLTPVDKR